MLSNYLKRWFDKPVLSAPKGSPRADPITTPAHPDPSAEGRRTGSASFFRKRIQSLLNHPPPQLFLFNRGQLLQSNIAIDCWCQ